MGSPDKRTLRLITIQNLEMQVEAIQKLIAEHKRLLEGDGPVKSGKRNGISGLIEAEIPHSKN